MKSWMKLVIGLGVLMCCWSCVANAVQEKAETICSDSLMSKFFPLKRDYYRLQREGSVPPKLFRAVEDLKAVIQQHYIQNYLLFYDILCIDSDGEIFYTIRKQTDYHKNIFSGVFTRNG